jgi:hypothetical protein
MLTLQFRRTCCVELQSLAIDSEVKEYAGILSAKSIVSRLLAIATVVIYQLTKSGE